MELSPPLRWLAAIGVMLVVVVVAGALLLNTLGNTFSLSDDVSEEPSDALGDEPSEGASDVADAGSDASEEGGGSGSDTSGDAGDGGSGDEFPQQYTVQSGDTGNDISEQFYGNRDGWPAIAEANDIDPGAPLRVGLELEIPAPE